MRDALKKGLLFFHHRTHPIIFPQEGFMAEKTKRKPFPSGITAFRQYLNSPSNRSLPEGVTFKCPKGVTFESQEGVTLKNQEGSVSQAQEGVSLQRNFHLVTFTKITA